MMNNHYYYLLRICCRIFMYRINCKFSFTGWCTAGTFCAGFKFGLFFKFSNVSLLITLISSSVLIFKIIGISAIFNFTCQGSIYFCRDSFLCIDPKIYLSTVCFLISRIFCVLDRQHIVEWFITV